MFQPKTIAMLRGLFGKDEDGNVFLRLVEEKPKGEVVNAVSTLSNRSLEDLVQNSVVLDKDGNPALRILGVDFGSTVEDYEKGRKLQMIKQEEERKQRIAESFKPKTEKQ